MSQSEIIARRNIRVLNDSLHQRTFMSSEEFCDAIERDFPNVSSLKFDSGQVLIPAKPVIKVWAESLKVSNYYPTYINKMMEAGLI